MLKRRGHLPSLGNLRYPDLIPKMTALSSSFSHFEYRSDRRCKVRVTPDLLSPPITAVTIKPHVSGESQVSALYSTDQLNPRHRVFKSPGSQVKRRTQQLQNTLGVQSLKFSISQNQVCQLCGRKLGRSTQRGPKKRELTSAPLGAWPVITNLDTKIPRLGHLAVLVCSGRSVTEWSRRVWERQWPRSNNE